MKTSTLCTITTPSTIVISMHLHSTTECTWVYLFTLSTLPFQMCGNKELSSGKSSTSVSVDKIRISGNSLVVHGQDFSLLLRRAPVLSLVWEQNSHKLHGQKKKKIPLSFQVLTFIFSMICKSKNNQQVNDSEQLLEIPHISILFTKRKFIVCLFFFVIMCLLCIFFKNHVPGKTEQAFKFNLYNKTSSWT